MRRLWPVPPEPTRTEIPAGPLPVTEGERISAILREGPTTR